MDQTAIQEGALTKAAAASAPPPGSNGEAPAPEPSLKVKKPAKTPILQLLEMLADLRITVFLFVLALFIVFWGTLAQVDQGVTTVVARYFRNWYILVPLRVVLFNSIGKSDLVIPFPGGWLVGGAMLINLLAAHAIRFKLSWKRSGIILIHAGVIVIMIGEFITGIYQVEAQMVIPIGQNVNQVMHPGTAEFVVIRTLDDKKDEVVSVPKSRLHTGAVIDDASVPFKMEITEYMPNSDFGINGKIDPDARGHARIHFVKPIPEVSGVDPNAKFDVPSMYAKLTGRDGKDLGKWLFSAHLENQFIKIGDQEYQLALRFKQKERPFKFFLKDFKHDVFPGTNTPRDFHSYIQLTDPEYGIVDRPVEIYMNAPFYYRGETFYQSSWTTDPITKKANGTILQVVHNPGWIMPYLACFLVGAGMLVHFGQTLYKFLERRMVR
jgi:hypothetical protein